MFKTDPRHNPQKGHSRSDDDWGIAEMAAHFDVTPRAIRFYEDKGLISPRRANGSRVFSPTDRERFGQILRAKRLGFSLEDIFAVQEVADGKVNDHAELLRRKQNFEKAIKSLRQRRRDADIVAKQMQGLCAAIEEYVETEQPTGVFQYAEAYDALFRKQMDEDFSPL